MLYRIFTIVRKELQALLRDRQGRLLLVVPVLLQLSVFPFAATLEVTNNTLAVLNEDTGAHSAEIIQRLGRLAAFSELQWLRSEGELRRAIDNQRALIVVRFPPDFSRALARGETATVQAILDGRRSNSGQIALSYVQRVLRAYAEEELGGRTPAPAQLVVRHWFNPNLDFVRHILPSLVAIITAISTLVVTALSVAREREQGTLDQLLVSPLTPEMIMVGKTVPAMLVGAFQGSIILAAGVFVYRIPFAGNVLLLYGSMVFYILALAGFGLLISSLCSTQQQAFLGVFSFIMPAILLSGFPSPVENMPGWLQRIDWFNPLQHFIVIVKGVFIKDLPGSALLPSLWPLLIIATVTLTAADWLFRHRTS